MTNLTYFYENQKEKPTSCTFKQDQLIKISQV